MDSETTRSVRCVAAFLVAACTGGFCSGGEATAVVCLDPGASILWKTVTSSSMPVGLDWPAGADKAVVSVGGAVRQTVTDTSALSADVSFDLPTVAADERVVELTLRFLGPGGAEVASHTARIGLVAGTHNAESVVLRGWQSSAWSRLKADHGVLPIPEGTSSFMIDGTEATGYDSPGWFFWTGVGPMSHALALLSGGEEYGATVFGVGGLIFVLQ